MDREKGSGSSDATTLESVGEVRRSCQEVKFSYPTGQRTIARLAATPGDALPHRSDQSGDRNHTGDEVGLVGARGLEAEVTSESSSLSQAG
jgi:hypothetical protein